MAFSVTKGHNKIEGDRRDKYIPKVGRYVARVDNLRDIPAGIFIDYTIEVDGQPIETYWCKNPNKASQQWQIDNDHAEVLYNIGAVCGLAKTQVKTLLTQERFDAAFAPRGGKSPLAGRKVNLVVVEERNKNSGKVFTKEVFEPFFEPGAVVEFAPAAGLKAATVPSAAPPPPTTKPTFEAAMAAAGYVLYPENPAYAKSADGYVEIAELKKVLGY